MLICALSVTVNTSKIYRPDFTKRNSFSDTSSSGPETPVDEKKGAGFFKGFGSKKKNFKDEIFKPTFNYTDLVLPDLNDFPNDDSVEDLSTDGNSKSSSSPSISVPEPAVTQGETGVIEVPRRMSASRSLPVDIPTSVSNSDEPHRHSHDMV